MADGIRSDVPGTPLEQVLRDIDELLDRAFPAEFVRISGGFSGPGYHLLRLQFSQDFWDVPDLELIEAAFAEMEADLDVLANGLIDRWGRAEEVELWEYAPGGPEPLTTLAQSAPKLWAWRPGGDRFVALAIGQADKELPVELWAAVGLCVALPDVSMA
jgi:hypothetical protein